MRKFEKISINQWSKDTGRLFFREDDCISAYQEINIPRRGTRKSAGYDISTPVECTIEPGQQVKIPTGIKANMDDDDVLLIFIRSSMASKKGIKIVNQTGVIDADYYNNIDNEGHIWIVLENTSGSDVTLFSGERIAQGVFLKFGIVEDDIPINDERVGGFGSTNK